MFIPLTIVIKAYMYCHIYLLGIIYGACLVLTWKISSIRNVDCLVSGFERCTIAVILSGSNFFRFFGEESMNLL
jgi:hypothetical protein